MSKTLAHTTGARKATLEIIRALTGQANILTIPREFINYMGSLDSALFLSQLLYWSDKGGRADGFIFKTYKEWKQEINLSEYEVKKAVKVLKDKGILETAVMMAYGSPTVHYRLDLEKFSDSFLEFLQKQETEGSIPEKLQNRNLRNSGIETEESAESLTETTTKNTTETTTERVPETEHSHIEDSTVSSSTANDVGDGDSGKADVNLTAKVEDGVIEAEPVFESKAIAVRSFVPATGRAVQMTGDWQPPPELRAWAETKVKPGVDINRATEKFKAYNHGKWEANWVGKWQTWMLNERVNDYAKQSSSARHADIYANRDYDRLLKGHV